MKKFVLLSVLFGIGTLVAHAQDDDMYFVPTKKNLEKERLGYGIPSDTYYSGSSRSLDEYNRRGSYYQPIGGESAGNDIINFSSEQGVYPDSTADYTITKKMSRWDGYTPTDAYWQGYERGRDDSWFAWHSPWYYSYYPWYDSYWYWDSWGYPWYYSWRYDPWYPYHHHYYASYAFGGPIYGGGGVVRTRNTAGAGTIDRYGRTGNSRVAQSNVRNRTSRTISSYSSNSSPSYSSYGSSGGQRSYSYSSGSSSSSSSSSFGGGGGGSRSYSGGGSRGGGGGTSSRHR